MLPGPPRDTGDGPPGRGPAPGRGGELPRVRARQPAVRPPSHLGLDQSGNPAGCARGHLARQRRRRRRHVLDLRDGWGGAWPQYLSIFMREVPVLEKVDRDGAVQGVDPQLRKPAAVLVNGGTRSGRGASLCHQEAPAGSPGRRAGGRAHPGRRSHRGEAADDCQSGAGPGPANTALGRPTEGRLGPREAIRALVRLDEGPRAARPNRWEPASRPGVRAPGFRTRRGRWNRRRSPKVL